MADRWTDERVALLTKLYVEGRSAEQIAAALGDGVTRNAVIGKWHRLGLTGRAVKATPPTPEALRSKKPRRAAAPTEPVMPICNPAKVSPIPPAPEQPDPIGAGPAHAALMSCHCRWPIGDPASESFRFCAEPCMRPQDMPRAGSGQLRVPVYCAAHYDRSVQVERRTTRIMAAAA